MSRETVNALIDRVIAKHPFDHKVTAARQLKYFMALGTLSQIRKETIDAWLQAAPIEWVDNAQREAMLSWWGSSAMQARVSECVKYCQP